MNDTTDSNSMPLKNSPSRFLLAEGLRLIEKLDAEKVIHIYILLSARLSPVHVPFTGHSTQTLAAESLFRRVFGHPRLHHL